MRDRSEKIAYERSISLKGEAEELASFFENEVLPKAAPGSVLTVSGALWQSRRARGLYLSSLRRMAEEKGFSVSEKSVLLSAYKEGLSFAEEVFAPALVSLPDVFRVEIAYDPRSLGGGDAPIMENPPRLLEDLYPADARVAEAAGIPRERVTFAPLPDGGSGYVMRAFDEKSACLVRMDHTPAYHTRPYLAEFPEAGVNQCAVSYLCAEIVGEEGERKTLLLKKAVPTDAERMLACLESEVLPEVWDRLVKDGRLKEEPLFEQLYLDITLGGMEESGGSVMEIVSAGETVEENLKVLLNDYFREKMKAAGLTGRRAIGGVVPVVHVRDGVGPEIAVRVMYRAAFAGELVETGQDVRNSGRDASAKEQPGTVQDVRNSGRDASAKEQPGTVQNVRNGGRDASSREQPEAALDVWNKGRLFGYKEYAALMRYLSDLDQFRVWRAAVSRQERDIWAVEICPDGKKESLAGGVSAFSGEGSASGPEKMRPCLLINGRHHANEVSASNAIAMFLEQMVTDPELQELARRVRVVVLPMENVDGAALHAELSKEHPAWQRHSCYENSVGADLMPYYYREEAPAVCPEAQAFTDIVNSFRPEIIVDCHGVPHHESGRQFDRVGSFRGLWLPRAEMCTFYYVIADPAYPEETRYHREFHEYLSGLYAEDASYQARAAEMNAIYEKYTPGGDPVGGDDAGGLLHYVIPSPARADHPYPTVRRPDIVRMMLTAEAADETASGEELMRCAGLHLRNIISALRFLAAKAEEGGED